MKLKISGLYKDVYSLLNDWPVDLPKPTVDYYMDCIDLSFYALNGSLHGLIELNGDGKILYTFIVSYDVRLQGSHHMKDKEELFKKMRNFYKNLD